MSAGAGTFEEVLQVMARASIAMEDSKQLVAEAGRELTRLRAVNAELLEALQAMLDIAPMARTPADMRVHTRAAAAIQKAGGQ
jgi:hypothetical protein